MGHPQLKATTARRGHPAPKAASTVRRFTRRRRPAPAPGQLSLPWPTHTWPADRCQWCGQEPTAYSPEGTAWCLAHTPLELLP
jgi:hypothetical protein